MIESMDTLICLDIDGTITEDKFSVPEEIREYLKNLSLKGYPLAFVTGRDFTFAHKAIEKFDFSYSIACQNGSIILSMPEKKELFRNYLDGSILPILEKAYEEVPIDFLIYSGYEKGDFCFYRKKNLQKESLMYIEDLQKRQNASWQEVEDFDPRHFSSFPLIKGFGPAKVMEMIKEKLSEYDFFDLSLIHDPFDDRYRLLQITKKGVSKGSAVSYLKKHLNLSYTVVAGDDENDESMIDVADKKIVVTTAPTSLKEKADIIALNPNELGIIHALNEALF